jgi:hypothetical protein
MNQKLIKLEDIKLEDIKLEDIKLEDNIINDHELIMIKKNIIDKLPKEIIEKIYKDYLESEIWYDKYICIIKDEISISLNNTLLLPIIPIILSKPIVSKFIEKKCYGFNNSYKSHKIEKRKVFKLMNNGHSFTSTILFYLYH